MSRWGVDSRPTSSFLLLAKKGRRDQVVCCWSQAQMDDYFFLRTKLHIIWIKVFAKDLPAKYTVQKIWGMFVFLPLFPTSALYYEGSSHWNVESLETGGILTFHGYLFAKKGQKKNQNSFTLRWKNGHTAFVYTQLFFLKYGELQ